MQNTCIAKWLGLWVMTPCGLVRQNRYVLPKRCWYNPPNNRQKFIHSFIHSSRNLSSDKCRHLPNPVLRTVLSSAYSFNVQYPTVYLKSLSSCLLVPPSFKKHFLCNMWPIRLAFLLFIVCKTSPPLPLAQRNTLLISHTISLTDFLHPYSAPHLNSKTNLSLIHYPKCPLNLEH